MKSPRSWFLIAIICFLSFGIVQSQHVALLWQTSVNFIYLDDLQSENAIIPIQWLTNIELTDDMVFVVEQITPNGENLPIQIPYTTPWESQPGLVYVQPQMIAGASEIHLRGQLVEDEDILATFEDTIDLRDSIVPPPSISPELHFDNSTLILDDDDRLVTEVAWKIVDRPVDTNLVFEQILPDETVVNIEQDRSNVLIPTEANGLGIVMESDEPIQLRTRLFDLNTGHVITQTSTTIDYDPIQIPLETLTNPNPSPPTTNPPLQQPSPVPPTPTHTPTPAFVGGTPTVVQQVPQINSFTINPNPVSRSGTITFVWNTQGLTTLGIIPLSEKGGIFQETIASALPDVGVTTYMLPQFYVSQAEFILVGTDENGERHQVQEHVEIECPYQPAYGADCPYTQQTVEVVSQVFEGGLMLWRADTRNIYVFYTTGQYAMYPDTWTGDEYDAPDQAPEGYYIPQRGFGSLWAWVTEIRTRLGYATTLEQPASVVWETEYDWRYGLERVTLALPTGGVIQFPNSIGQWGYFE